MRFLRFGPPGEERPGIIDSNGDLRDLSELIPDITPSTIGSGRLQQLTEADIASLPTVSGTPRVGACVADVGKCLCIGLNYSDHAEEAGMQAPPEPIIFAKATTALMGPNDDIVIPRGSTRTDWEVELAIVVGRETKYVEASDALKHIAGYAVFNDVSERDFQLERAGQWTKGKSADTFGPLGPYLVTPDEVPDPNALSIWLEHNGTRVQDGTTATMIYKVAYLVSYISQFMRLMPGDVIATGTPAGVGMGLSPPRYLKPGDQLKLGIDGLGVQTQSVRASD